MIECAVSVDIEWLSGCIHVGLTMSAAQVSANEELRARARVCARVCVRAVVRMRTVWVQIRDNDKCTHTCARAARTHAQTHTIKIQVLRTREVTKWLPHSKANRSEEAVRMLERCVRLDAAYVPAYLLLARLYQGQEGRDPAVEHLLRHVARLQPNSSDHLAELAAWLHQKGWYSHREFCVLYLSHWCTFWRLTYV
jgi:hypothetical protein